MIDKEKIYDEQVFPLMKQIIEICKKEQLPFFAECQYSDEGFVKTLVGTTDDDIHPIIEMLEALTQCIEGNGVNIDMFILCIMKRYSMVLKILGNVIEKNVK